MKSGNTRIGSTRGFTMTEVLVVIGIVAVLAALGGTAIVSAVEKARMATEINAARNLVTGWSAYAADHGGKVMPGFQADEGLTNLDGESLRFPVNARYPWKLAPYVGRMEEAIVFNGNEKLLDRDYADYRVSVSPNLGVNAVFVGGHFGSGSPLPPSSRVIERLGKFHVTHLSDPVDPARLIVFASACSDEGNDGVGFYEVRAPMVREPVWSGEAFDQEGRPSDHGWVDFRWSGRAVVATAGGGVELLTEKELRDMRRWANEAARRNDPDYVVGE